MPLEVRPDPQHPGQWIWVDSATGQPAAQPGGPGTPYVAPTPTPATTVAAPSSIDANASRTTTTSTSIGPPQAAGPNPSGTAGQYTVEQILAPFDAEFSAANQTVLDLNDKINGRHGQKDANGNPLPDTIGSAAALAAAQANAIADPAAAQSATTTYQADLNAWSAAQSRLAAANVARQNALQTAIDKNEVTPAQAQLAKAQADEAGKRGAQIDSQVKIAADLAPSQQALLVSQAAQASAQAALDDANAAKASATTPSEIALANAQAAQAQANANATNAMVQVNVARVQADTTLTQHQTSLTDANSTLALANADDAKARAALQDAQAKLLVPAQAGLAGAQAGLAGAQTAASKADVQKGLLGPLYGLQDQVNAIRAIQQQVFGPGGSGNADEANKMLQDYVQATVAGTTPYAANVAAANFGQNQYATQASMTNAAQAAAASRSNAFLGTGANVLGTLAQMNANAPKGSTAGAGAFMDIMNMLQQRSAQGAMAPPQQPTAPQLPALLAGLAHQGGGGPQTSAPVTINIGSGGGGGAGASLPMPSMPPTPVGPAPSVAPSQPFSPYTSSPNQMPGQNYGAPAGPAVSNAIPSYLQNMSLGTTGSLTNLWQNELGSGAVSLPTSFQPPSVPSVM